MHLYYHSFVIVNISILTLNIIFTGGGGVGKTFLIKTISKWAEKILRNPGDDPLNPKVLLLGPTGKSASLIGKSFSFNVLNLTN